MVSRPDDGRRFVSGHGLLSGENRAGHQADSAFPIAPAGNTGNELTVVVDGADGARSMGAVIVARDVVRRKVVDENFASVAASRQGHAAQVRVREVDSAINDGHDHFAAASGEFLPYRLDVDVHALFEIRAQRSVIDIVPLLLHIGIVEIGAPGLAEGHLHELHARQRSQIRPRLGNRDGRVILDAVPAVQAGSPVFRFKLTGIREHPLRGHDTQLGRQFRVIADRELVGQFF